MTTEKGGRPKYQIDFETLDSLCNILCTGEEIAAILGVDYDTLNRRLKQETNLGFADYLKKMSAGGKMSLRRKQIETALDGNVTMLIWCGKQHLGQRDNIDQALSGNVTNINISADDYKKARQEALDIDDC